jgi:hypothetical protein
MSYERIGHDRATEADDRAHDGLERIQAALRGLRFGSVTAVVQDGVIVQVDRTEKVRLERYTPRRG